MAAVMAVMAVSHGGGWQAWRSWHPFWAFFFRVWAQVDPVFSIFPKPLWF
ncbi:phage tail tape measure protein [Sesbania bispinosa]|nr:phage tail tape measure protein [Sesbania bispinosa]